MKNLILIFGLLALLSLVSADTTTSNITVNNTQSIINKVFTYNQSSMDTSSFTYLENLSVRVNVTDLNGIADLRNVSISLITYNGTVLVRNASMTNITQITNGFTYEYNYTLNKTSYPGNYTITILANDSANNEVTNSSTQFRVKLVVRAIVPDYDSCANQEIRLWNTSIDTTSETELSSNLTNSNCQVIYSYPFSKYHIWHHPTTDNSVYWDYQFTRYAYQEVDITGSSLGGGGGGGGGGGTYIIPVQTIQDFIFDVTINSFVHSGNQLYSEVTIKNIVATFGDIQLLYLIKQNDSIFNSVSEQVFIDSYNQSDECSTVTCPHAHTMAMVECVQDTFLKVIAKSLPNAQNLTHVLAEAEVQVCSAEQPLEVTPEFTTTTIQEEQKPAEDYTLLTIGGTALGLLACGVFIFWDRIFAQ